MLVRVTDGRGGEATQAFVIAVAQANRPPTIVTTAPTTATTGAAYSYDVDATDPDGDMLSYALATAPTGMAIADAASTHSTARSRHTSRVTVLKRSIARASARAE